MSTDITDVFETAADGTGTVRAAFDATAAECRPDIEALTRRALERGTRVRRHRTVGKAVGSAAAAAAIGLGTVYALNESGSSARPASVPGSTPSSTPTSAPTSDTVTPTPTASVANAIATWRATHRSTLTSLKAAAWL